MSATPFAPEEVHGEFLCVEGLLGRGGAPAKASCVCCANFIGCPSKAKLISLAGSGATGNMNLPASAVSPLNLERWYCFIASMDIK